MKFQVTMIRYETRFYITDERAADLAARSNFTVQ